MKIKLTIAVLITIACLACPQVGCTGNIELVTYYPAPQGVYDRLTLLPQASLPASCAIGSISVEQDSGKIFYCHDILGVGTWGPISQVWTVSGNNVYPTLTDTNPLIFAGIGTSAPSFKLTLDNDGGILATGTFGAGIITTYPSIAPDENAPPDARFIWYPRKAAFRAIWDRWGVTDDTKMGNYSVGFGDTPTVTGTAAVASGLFNTASGNYATVAGGKSNSVSGDYSTITGGETNRIISDYSVISGSNNVIGPIYADYSTIAGGQGHVSIGIGQTIGGGLNNKLDQPNSSYSTISGGELNRVYGSSPFINYAVISGGYQNTAEGDNYTTIGGGKSNIAIGDYSFIGAGASNTTNGSYSVIGGGHSNTTTGDYSVITGGHNNKTNPTTGDNYAVVLGGESNTANGQSSVIAGGSFNFVGKYYSVIAGGDHNTVASDYSWAGGRYMNLSGTADRTFVWGYSGATVDITAADAFILTPGTSGTSTFNAKLSIGETNPSAILSITGGEGSHFLAITSTAAAAAGNIFIIKDNGYVGIGNNNPQYPLQVRNIAGPSGILNAAGVWTTPSSRKFKNNIKPLDTSKATAIFRKLNPVTFNYKINPSEHHVGFIAEDVPDLAAAEERNSVDTLAVSTILTSVLKEQQRNIAKQDEVLNNLENDVQSLKRELLNR